MRVGQHDADQIIRALLDKFEIGENEIDAGIFRAGEGHAEIDHQPLAVRAIQIDVHTNLSRPAEGKEQQFVLRSVVFLQVVSFYGVRSAINTSPSNVRSVST